MSRYFLVRILIEGFRGINNENQPLELGFKADAVNSVFAANATGKSSIFEALCYAIRGHVPKLRALQAAERPDQYVTNLFHSGRTAAVELDLLDEANQRHVIRVRRTATGQRVVDSPSGSTDPEGMLKSLDEDFTLLDYEQFASFINRTPLERGRSFAALLGLSGYSQLRQLLQNLSDTRNLNSDFDLPALQATVRENDSHSREAFGQFSRAYTGLTGRTPGDASDVIKWARDIRDALVSIELLRPGIGARKLSDIDFVELRGLVRSEEGGAKRDELGKLVEATGRLGSLEVGSSEDATGQADELANAISRRLELLTATPGPAYQKLQDAALHLYKSSEWHDANRCALCRSELSGPVLAKIEAEVARFEAVRLQEQVIGGLVDSAGWLRSLAKLETVPELKVPAPTRLAASVVESARRGTLTAKLVTEALDLFFLLRGRLSAEIAGLALRRTELEKELPPSLVAVTTQIEQASQARDSLSSYWRATETSAGACTAREI